MFYYNPIAVHPPIEAVQLMDDVKWQVEKLKRTCIIKTRRVRHAFCHLLRMRDFDYVCRSMGRNDDLRTLRQFFLTPPLVLK